MAVPVGVGWPCRGLSRCVRPSRGPARKGLNRSGRSAGVRLQHAPSVGGVRLPKGQGEVVKLPRGASLTDFADKIGANPAALVQVLFHLGEMVTSTQSVSDEILELLGSEMNYQVQVVSPEEEDRELLDSFSISFGETPATRTTGVPAAVVTVMGHVDTARRGCWTDPKAHAARARPAASPSTSALPGGDRARGSGPADHFIDTRVTRRSRHAGPRREVHDIAVIVVAADDA